MITLLTILNYNIGITILNYKNSGWYLANYIKL